MPVYQSDSLSLERESHTKRLKFEQRELVPRNIPKPAVYRESKLNENLPTPSLE